jgi:hypothetical protein
LEGVPRFKGTERDDEVIGGMDTEDAAGGHGDKIQSTKCELQDEKGGWAS